MIQTAPIRMPTIAPTREHPPSGVSADAAAREIREVLDSIGDTGPECPPEQATLKIYTTTSVRPEHRATGLSPTRDRPPEFRFRET
jgi:hypothetical protein